jgi:hypothetical protein
MLLKSVVGISNGPHYSASLVRCVGGWVKTCCGRKHNLVCVVGRSQAATGVIFTLHWYDTLSTCGESQKGQTTHLEV